MAAPLPTSRSQKVRSSRLFGCRCNDCRSRVTWSRRREYRVEKPVAKLGDRNRSSVVELSIRNPARPAQASAGRCVFKELGGASDDERSLETFLLAPRLAPRRQAGITPAASPTPRALPLTPYGRRGTLPVTKMRPAGRLAPHHPPIEPVRFAGALEDRGRSERIFSLMDLDAAPGPERILRYEERSRSQAPRRSLKDP